MAFISLTSLERSNDPAEIADENKVLPLHQATLPLIHFQAILG